MRVSPLPAAGCRRRPASGKVDAKGEKAADLPSRKTGTRGGAQRRSAMTSVAANLRHVALDLGGKKTTYCEVKDGQVVERTTVKRVGELLRWLGPETPRAQVAFEACREGWHVHALLLQWGQAPMMVDTTRSRQLGIGHHRRKTDRIDAEVLARALDAGRLPLAHVLTPERQQLRFQLNVRRALVETHAHYVATIRDITRAHGVRLRSCATDNFAAVLEETPLRPELRELVAPIAAQLRPLEAAIGRAEIKLQQLAEAEPAISLLATAPGVALIVAAAFVSVVDEAGRFRRAHEVESYLGLVPSEDTSGKRRLGAITKQGNSYARAMLVQAAWTILRSRSDDPLTQWGKAVAARRGRRVAAVAVARRLVGILWAMWRDGTVYDPEALGRLSAGGIARHAQQRDVQAAALRRAAQKLQRQRRKAERAALAGDGYSA